MFTCTHTPSLAISPLPPYTPPPHQHSSKPSQTHPLPTLHPHVIRDVRTTPALPHTQSAQPHDTIEPAHRHCFHLSEQQAIASRAVYRLDLQQEMSIILSGQQDTLHALEHVGCGLPGSRRLALLRQPLDGFAGLRGIYMLWLGVYAEEVSNSCIYKTAFH